MGCCANEGPITAPNQPPLIAHCWLHLAEVRHGQWCPKCLLPSAVQIRMIASLGHPLEPPYDTEKANIVQTVCVDCGLEIED